MGQSLVGNDYAERERLAGEIIRLTGPDDHLDAPNVERGVAALQAALTQTTVFSGGIEELDYEQLQRSFEVAARNSATLGPSRVKAIFAEHLDAKILSDVLAFYQSSDGRASLDAMLAYSDLFFEWEKRRVGLPPVYTESQAEAAFYETESGREYRSVYKQEILPIGYEILKTNIRAASEDYCAHAVCDSGQRDLFERMAIIIDIYAQAQ